MALRAILFDKDGTLIDFDATWGPAAYEVMRALAGADEEAFAELVRVSDYVLEERRFFRHRRSSRAPRPITARSGPRR